MIFKNAKYPEEAADFLKFFFQEENYIKYLHTVPIHLLPTLKSVRNNPAYQANEMYRAGRSGRIWTTATSRRDLAKPTLVVDWDDLKLPFGLEILGSEHRSGHGDGCRPGHAVRCRRRQGPGPGRGVDHQARVQTLVGHGWLRN